MRILTCLKQVREPQSPLEIGQGCPSWPGAPLFKMAAYDEMALEEALCLKDGLPGSEVWAASAGGESACAVLRRALGMGADQAALLLDPEEPAPRPLALASALAVWARPHDFDLILCGVISEDLMQGAVGPLLAGLLDLPCLTAVVEVELDPARRLARAWREMEGGRRQRLELPLPALLTIQASRKPPRYPTLSALLRAKQAAIPSLAAASLASPPPREQGLGLELPPARRTGRMLSGGVQEQARELAGILRGRALL